MNAIGEQTLRWFSAERTDAEPDLTTLVRDYSGVLYRVAFSILRNQAEAEDVVQDVFVRVLQRRRELGGILDVKPWLVRIAWNLSLDRVRKIAPEQMDESFAAAIAGTSAPADQALAVAERMAHVLAAMDRLPKKERQVLVLSAMKELSTAEIGAVLGVSESSVRSLLFRARTHLRQRLES